MRVLAILNPTSGNRPIEVVRRDLMKTISSYTSDFNLRETQGADDAYNLAKEFAKNGGELVIAAGGDGTIKEIVNALAYTDTAMAIMPNGTGNLLANALCIPMDIGKAVNIAFEGKQKTIDLGKVQGEYFAVIAGCGFDADVMNTVSRKDKKFLGMMAYFWAGFRLALWPKKAVFKIEADDKIIKRRAFNVLVVNSASILGELLQVVPNTSLNDGLLDLCIFSPKNQAEIIELLWRMFSKENYENDYFDKKAMHIKAKKIKIHARPKTHYQADGDIQGYTPIELEACPAALKVMIPADPSVCKDSFEMLQKIIYTTFPKFHWK